MTVRVVPVDLKNEAVSRIWPDLLDHYASDPMGGGEGLSEYARANLVGELQDLPTFHGALAFEGERAVGLINCFAGFSTFAAKPLINIHDVVVHADHRRIGIAQALLEWAEERARLALLQADPGNPLGQYAGDGFLRASGVCSL